MHRLALASGDSCATSAYDINWSNDARTCPFLNRHLSSSAACSRTTNAARSAGPRRATRSVYNTKPTYRRKTNRKPDHKHLNNRPRSPLPSRGRKKTNPKKNASHGPLPHSSSSRCASSRRALSCSRCAKASAPSSWQRIVPERENPPAASRYRCVY